MTRRVLIASTSSWSFCLAAERAIARANEDAQVDVVDIFRLCGAHSPHWRRRDLLIERASRKLERFVLPVINGRNLTSAVQLDTAAIPQPPVDVSGLRGYSVGPARVGLGVLSSVITLTTVQRPVSTAEYGAAFPAAWTAAHLSHQLGAAMTEKGYDEVYVFNGRACYSRPFCDVMERSARVVRYEREGAENGYIQADGPIHNPAVLADLARAHDFHPEAGESFYHDRLRKAPGDIVNFFTSGQIEGHIPTAVQPGSFVALFTSSSDELAAVSDNVGYGDFPNQFEVALAIARIARSQGQLFVLRLHPHLQHKHESWRREWDFQRLRDEGALVIPPEDPCDTYALAAAAHCVFTCGSTVGFECSFRGISTAEVGDSLGARLGAMWNAKNEADIAAFMEHPSLPERARTGALMWGSYLRCGGKPLPELNLGSHPNYARIDDRIVDPLRYAAQKMKDVSRTKPKTPLPGMGASRAVLEPSREAAEEQGAS